MLSALDADAKVAIRIITLSCFTDKKARRRRSVFAAVSALLYSLMVMLGYAMARTHSLSLYTANSQATWCAVGMFALLLLGFFVLIWALLAWMEARDKSRIKLGQAASKLMPQSWLVWLVLFIFLLLAWSPWLIAYAPGTTSRDIERQIAQYIGRMELSTHHPLAATALYGAVFDLGTKLTGSESGGLCFDMALQAICLAAACAFQLKVMRELLAPRWAVVLAALFFAIVPVFGEYCQWIVKDTVFAAAFVVYASLYILFVKDSQRFFSHKSWLVFFLTFAFLTCILRNNGYYIVLLSLPWLALLRDTKKAKGYTAILFIALVLVVPLFNRGVTAITQAASGSIAEALSLPFMQTARYVVDHGDEVEAWEQEAIDDVLDYENLPELYTPEISDDVKRTFKEDGDLGRYFKAWIAQGLRHPLTYLEATMSQTYKYWYFETGMHPTELGGHHLNYTEYFNFEYLNDGGIFGLTKDKLAAWLVSFKQAPVIGWLCMDGLYFWIFLFGAIYLLYRKKPRYLLIMLPCAVLWLTCIAGPLNGSLRYLLGMISMLPITLAAVSYFSRWGHSQKPAEQDSSEISQQ